jgi:hypothetical protein
MLGGCFTAFSMTRGGGSLAIVFNTCVTEPPDDFTNRHYYRCVAKPCTGKETRRRGTMNREFRLLEVTCWQLRVTNREIK